MVALAGRGLAELDAPALARGQRGVAVGALAAAALASRGRPALASVDQALVQQELVGGVGHPGAAGVRARMGARRRPPARRLARRTAHRAGIVGGGPAAVGGRGGGLGVLGGGHGRLGVGRGVLGVQRRLGCGRTGLVVRRGVVLDRVDGSLLVLLLVLALRGVLALGLAVAVRRQGRLARLSIALVVLPARRGAGVVGRGGRLAGAMLPLVLFPEAVQRARLGDPVDAAARTDTGPPVNLPLWWVAMVQQHRLGPAAWGREPLIIIPHQHPVRVNRGTFLPAVLLLAERALVAHLQHADAHQVGQRHRRLHRRVRALARVLDARAAMCRAMIVTTPPPALRARCLVIAVVALLRRRPLLGTSGAMSLANRSSASRRVLGKCASVLALPAESRQTNASESAESRQNRGRTGSFVGVSQHFGWAF